MATASKTIKTATSRKTTARKSTAAGKTRAAAPKSAAKSTATTKLTGVTDAPAAVAEDKAPPAPVFKMQELMQALDGKSELKRAELRQTVGHVLDALGAALAQGNDLSLPGFGKITVKRREAKPGGEQIVARIKLNTPEPDPVRTPNPGEE